MSETFRCTWIKKTRKSHRCDWCWQVIPPGSRAHYHAGTFDGDFFHARMHPECWYALSACNWVNDDGYMPGDYARGRTDDDDKAPPQFSPDGTRIEVATV